VRAASDANSKRRSATAFVLYVVLPANHRHIGHLFMNLPGPRPLVNTRMPQEEIIVFDDVPRIGVIPEQNWGDPERNAAGR